MPGAIVPAKDGPKPLLPEGGLMITNFTTRIVLGTFYILFFAGCASMGPKTIGPDRIGYMEEISESWKKQMLLNIVKMRYLDPPTFLDVSSVINQYGLENQINTDARWSWPKPATEAANAGIGGYSRYSDRPTITYTPLSGQKFTKNLLTPIPPDAVVNLIQSGWPIDIIFSITVKAVNGVRNNSSVGDGFHTAKDFNILIKALRNVQRAGVADIRVDKIQDHQTVIFVISDQSTNEADRADSETIRRILKIRPGVNKYTIAFGNIPSNDEEIALLTRSMLEIMLEMAGTIEVPKAHVTEGRVRETPPISSGEPFLVRIHSAREKPKDAFTTVEYRHYWFWVDDTDMISKRNFSLMMIFLSLTESDKQSSSPLFTIGG